MKILDLITHLLYPWKCVFCESVLKDTDICHECEKKLPYTVGDSVAQKFPFIDKCVSPLYYKDKVRASVHRYKFGGCSSYSRRYGILMSDCVENNLDCSSIDVISWIPLSKKRLRQRGYDQARLIAEEISSKTGLPCRQLLQKVKNNGAQSLTRDAKQRRENVAGVYAMCGQTDVSGLRILLVDDVVTTGATMSEAARILRKAGAKAVYGAALARHED